MAFELWGWRRTWNEGPPVTEHLLIVQSKESIERLLSFPAVRIHSRSEVGNRADWLHLAQPGTLLPPFSFSIFFKTVSLCTGYHIVQNFLFLGGSLLILSHSTQASICLPGRCLPPKEQMVSLRSCSVFMVSQFLPDPMLSWLVAPAVYCVFSSFLGPPWELLVKS